MLTILIGKSGSGKDAVQTALVNDYGFERIVTTTTRPMREGEKDGVDYHFISRESFLNGIKCNDYIEYRSYNTLVNGISYVWYYGSSKALIHRDKNYVIILDAQGAEAFLSYYGKSNCFVVEIHVDDEVRKERAIKRGSFDETEWERRRVDDAIKFAPEKLINIVDYSLDNTKISIETAVKSVVAAINS